MSLVPAFEIGVWNAWILPLFFLVTMFAPNLILSEEGKKRNKRLEGFVTSNRTEKVLAWSTHLVIWPFVILYSSKIADGGFWQGTCQPDSIVGIR